MLGAELTQRRSRRTRRRGGAMPRQRPAAWVVASRGAAIPVVTAVGMVDMAVTAVMEVMEDTEDMEDTVDTRSSMLGTARPRSMAVALEEDMVAMADTAAAWVLVTGPAVASGEVEMEVARGTVARGTVEPAARGAAATGKTGEEATAPPTRSRQSDENRRILAQAIGRAPAVV
jgi:hypothetical protein